MVVGVIFEDLLYLQWNANEIQEGHILVFQRGICWSHFDLYVVACGAQPAHSTVDLDHLYVFSVFDATLF